MQIDEINGVLWINDSYNANPCSVKSLIDWVVSVDKEINYLVLGDMLELGESGTSLHLDTINYAKEKLPNTTLLTFGKIMSSVTKDDLSFIDIDKLKDFLKEHLKSGDRIAIKGSRKMELERLQI
jgi:UDP-N-acetylmuramoyl-tripeptide--D-alanyl-D-alanine ligase